MLRVTAVNHVNVEHRSNKETMELMSRASAEPNRSIALSVVRNNPGSASNTRRRHTGPNTLSDNARGDRPHEIRVPKTPTGLGISISAGGANAYGQSTIVVQHIVPKGNLDRDGHVKEGDTLVAIDGKSLLNLNVKEAVRLLASAKSECIILDITYF